MAFNVAVVDPKSTAECSVLHLKELDLTEILYISQGFVSVSHFSVIKLKLS